MLAFLNNYGWLLGIVSGVLGIIAFVESRRHVVFRQPGIVTGVVFCALCLIAITAGIVTNLEASGSNRTITNQLPNTDNPSTGAGISPTPTQVPSPIPSPTPKPGSGTVLCQADSSKGWNGWAGSPDWKVAGSMLVDDGTGSWTSSSPTINAPCQLEGITDYAVEVTAQIVQDSKCCDDNFGITVRGISTSNGWQGYGVGVVNGSVPTVQISAGYYNKLVYAEFNAGKSWHTYRVEVKGSDIKLLIDGAPVLETTDNRYLTGTQLGLWCTYYMQIDVSLFKVIAL